MPRRDRVQIVADILDAAKEGAKQTQIMYRARLSYKFLKEYMRRLIEEGLLTKDETAQKYVTSKKGLQYLSSYDYLKRSITVVENKKARLRELVQGE